MSPAIRNKLTSLPASRLSVLVLRPTDVTESTKLRIMYLTTVKLYIRFAR